MISLPNEFETAKETFFHRCIEEERERERERKRERGRERERKRDKEEERERGREGKDNRTKGETKVITAKALVERECNLH